MFFEWGRAVMGPRGRRIAAEAARNAGGAEGGGLIEPQAYADRSGRSERNPALSQRRAEAVMDEPVRQGIRRERITARAFGEGRPMVPTRDGEEEARNRGVWIVIR